MQVKKKKTIYKKVAFFFFGHDFLISHWISLQVNPYSQARKGKAQVLLEPGTKSIYEDSNNRGRPPLEYNDMFRSRN